MARETVDYQKLMGMLNLASGFAGDDNQDLSTLKTIDTLHHPTDTHKPN